MEPSSPQLPDINPTLQEEIICVLPTVAPVEVSSLGTQPNEGVTTPDITHPTSSRLKFEIPIISLSFERSKCPPFVDYPLNPLLTVPIDITEPKVTSLLKKTVCQLVTPVDSKLTTSSILIGLGNPAAGVDGCIHHSLRKFEKKHTPDRPPPWRNKYSPLQPVIKITTSTRHTVLQISSNDNANLLFYIQGNET